MYGYPNEPAAAIALKTVKDWLQEEKSISEVKEIIFCTFLDKDTEIYERLLLAK